MILTKKELDRISDWYCSHEGEGFDEPEDYPLIRKIGDLHDALPSNGSYLLGSPWVPVSARLPPEGQWVLVLNEAFTFYNVARYNPKARDDWEDAEGEWLGFDVTHWMPLPPPPE